VEACFQLLLHRDIDSEIRVDCFRVCVCVCVCVCVFVCMGRGVLYNYNAI